MVHWHSQSGASALGSNIVVHAPDWFQLDTLGRPRFFNFDCDLSPDDRYFACSWPIPLPATRYLVYDINRRIKTRLTFCQRPRMDILRGPLMAPPSIPPRATNFHWIGIENPPPAQAQRS